MPDDTAQPKPQTAPIIPVGAAVPPALPDILGDGTSLTANVAGPRALPVQHGEVRIVDYPVRLSGPIRYLLSYALFIACMIGLVFLLLPFIGALQLQGQLASFAVTLAMIFIVSLLIGVIPALQRWRARRIAMRILLDDASAPLAQIVERFMHRRPWLSGSAGAIELSQYLAAMGRTNVILRMAGRKYFWPIRPTQWAFEPRPLDESDSSFVELAEATAAEGSESGFEFTNPDMLPLRSIRRNIRMKGGYTSLAIILILWGRSLYECYLAGAPDIWLAFLSFILFRKLFSSPSAGYGAAQWYVVSRGAVVDLRKTKFGMPFMIYDRPFSVLVVYQRTRHTWNVSVCNQQLRYVTNATSREVELLLRTWCSDLAPPAGATIAALFADGVAKQRGA